jgi:organic anion transporter 3A
MFTLARVSVPQREKVKVYIDEKYHHATDPSIRPKHNQDEAEQQYIERYGKDIKDIPRSIWKLLTNKIYIITCMGACMELIIVSGFIVFLPKYLETQFNLDKSTASMFTGGIAIPGACIGIFLGGYILKRLQLRPKGAVQLVIFFNFLCLGCYTMLFFFGCENIKMAGTTMPYFHR